MCDTLVALPPATADGSVLFAKNSDRPAGEGQSIRTYPATDHAPDTILSCTYLDIPQAPRTHAVIVSQIDWMWGAEMGANDQGVVIGNEAVWSRVQPGPPALLGMDLVRLGLERGDSARNAVDVIVGLLEEHGQGGACAENDPSFTYDNSFLIVDAGEAWVLETAGTYWAAERVAAGHRNISNRLSIRRNHDRRSAELDTDIDFAARFSASALEPEPGSRERGAAARLHRHDGAITPETMMAILGDHDSGICMHGEFETTAAMVSRLHPNGTAEHWMTGASFPCRSAFERVGFSDPESVIDEIRLIDGAGFEQASI